MGRPGKAGLAHWFLSLLVWLSAPEAFLRLCLKLSRLLPGPVLVQDNWRVWNGLGFQCCRDGRGDEGTTLPSLQAPGRVAGLGWCGGQGGPASHQALPLPNKVSQAGEEK